MKKVKCYGRKKFVYVKPESSFISNFFDGDLRKSNLWNSSSSSRISFQDEKIYCDAYNKENINDSSEESPQIFNFSSSHIFNLNTPIKDITDCKMQSIVKKHAKSIRGTKIGEGKLKAQKKSECIQNPMQDSWSIFLNHNLVIENLNIQTKENTSLFTNVTGIECRTPSPSCVPVSKTCTNGKKRIRNRKFHSKNCHKSKEGSPLETEGNSTEKVNHTAHSSYAILPSCSLYHSASENFDVNSQSSNLSIGNAKIFTSTPVGSKGVVTNYMATNLITFCENKNKSMYRKLTNVFTTTPIEKSYEVLHDFSSHSFLVQDAELNDVDIIVMSNISNKASKINSIDCNEQSECNLAYQHSRSLTTSKTCFDFAASCKKSYSCLNTTSSACSERLTSPCEKFEDQLTKLLLLCNENSVKLFSELYDWRNCKVVKIGEGTYGEVFLITIKRKSSVLKVIPVSHKSKVDSFQELQDILSEVRISKCLSKLRNGGQNSSKNFCELKSVHVVTGHFPSILIQAWDSFSEAKSSYNIRPDEYSEDQLYVVLELEFGGKDMSCFMLKDSTEGESVLKQVAISLAIAEEEHMFEHRDLHLGNILVQRNCSKSITYKLRGKSISIPSCGLRVTIIDFTLSRLYESDALLIGIERYIHRRISMFQNVNNISDFIIYSGIFVFLGALLLLQSCLNCARFSGFVYYNNLAEDTSLFNQSGDYQFEVYRSMKLHLGNQWHECLLYSNVLWLNFLCVKLKDFSYSRPSTVKHAKSFKNIEHFQAKLNSCESAVDCLTKCQIVTSLPVYNPSEHLKLIRKSVLVATNSYLKSKSIQAE